MTPPLPCLSRQGQYTQSSCRLGRSLEGWGRWSAIFEALKVSEGKKRMIILSEDIDRLWILTRLLYYMLYYTILYYTVLYYSILSYPTLHFITQQLWLFLVFWCLRNVSFIVIFIDCFKLVVSQKNNVCVCVCMRACMHVCVCACVCVHTLLLLSILLLYWVVFSSVFYWIVDVLL